MPTPPHADGDSSTTAPSFHEVDFPPVQNGVDYLLSVVDHLTAAEQPGPRDLKYAVLHLQAAAEVLLKARLHLEHWSLVFKEPGQATRKKFEAGDFDSCTTAGAIARLIDIADVAVDDKAAKSLAILSRWRNALQHYGLKANARAVDTRAAQVLDFLIAFVHNELLPALPGEEKEAVRRDLDVVGDRVRTIKSFINARLKRLTDELKDVQHRTLDCCFCGESTLVVGESPKPLSCRFCHTTWDDPNHALTEYVMAYDVNMDGNVQHCPNCSEYALLVDGARVVQAPEQRRSLCFACGSDFDTLAECSDCLNTYIPASEDDLGLCEDCMDVRHAKF
ncbi:hypothetical protein AB1388_08310 [Streptomyces hydrogenans]|uniref:hypothetical protein n=1 Tax=Streptomyces hydrogenans TaxID=1873719 RepID=UPI00345CBB0A